MKNQLAENNFFYDKSGKSSKIYFGEICDEVKISENDRDRIMHIALPIGSGGILMANDVPESMGQTMPAENNFSLSISSESRDEAERIFNNLAENGKVEMPLADTFWGAYFGICEDQFGVRWMVDHDPNH